MSKAKTPTINAGIIKDHLPTLWSFWACEDNEVYYFVKHKSKFVWKTLKQMDDARDMLVFGSYKDANTVMRSIIQTKQFPSAAVNNFQIGPIIPSYEDGFWYQDVVGKVKDVRVNTNA